MSNPSSHTRSSPSSRGDRVVAPQSRRSQGPRDARLSTMFRKANVWRLRGPLQAFPKEGCAHFGLRSLALLLCPQTAEIASRRSKVDVSALYSSKYS
jgi:hypothetical protein